MEKDLWWDATQSRLQTPYDNISITITNAGQDKEVKTKEELILFINELEKVSEKILSERETLKEDNGT